MMDVDELCATFARQGYLNLGKVLSESDITRFTDLYEQDWRDFQFFWHQYGYHQAANYEALVTTPAFDALIRHPQLYPLIEAIMGGPLCFGEIGLRRMRAYAGDIHQAWHRDRPHWAEHPLRCDYLQLIVYLSDVDATTHCLSLSPESVGEAVLEKSEDQLARGGVVDVMGPAGTCAIFNASVLHTATTRPTKSVRRSVQIYYGHRHRAPLANDSGIPPGFWRDHPDVEARAFYSVLNKRTEVLMRAFGTPAKKDQRDA